MDLEKAEQVYNKLLDFFDRQFKAGRAVVTMSGTIKFDTEQDFGLWYQLSERLRKGNQDLYEGLIKRLRRWYAGKSVEEFERENRDRLDRTDTQALLDAIEASEDITLDFEII